MSGSLTGACAAHTRRPAPAGASFPHSRRRARARSSATSMSTMSQSGRRRARSAAAAFSTPVTAGTRGTIARAGCRISPSTRSPSTSAIHACGWEPTAECGRAVTTAPPGRRSLPTCPTSWSAKIEFHAPMGLLRAGTRSRGLWEVAVDG